MLLNSLIIGNDPRSGLIVLITDAENYGVYYWDHEEEEIEESIFPVCSSFTELLNRLYELEDEDE